MIAVGNELSMYNLVRNSAVVIDSLILSLSFAPDYCLYMSDIIKNIQKELQYNVE